MMYMFVYKKKCRNMYILQFTMVFNRTRMHEYIKYLTYDKINTKEAGVRNIFGKTKIPE